MGNWLVLLFELPRYYTEKVEDCLKWKYSDTFSAIAAKLFMKTRIP